MADSKLSALTAITSADGADEIYVNDGGTSKKITVTNLAPSTFNRLAAASASTSANAGDIFPFLEGGVTKTVTVTALSQTLNPRPAVRTAVATSVHTLSDAEVGTVIEFTHASGCKVTVPSSGMSMGVGSFIHMLATTSGQVVVSADGGAAVNAPGTFTTKLKQQWSSGSIYRQAAGVYVMSGHMSAA